MPIRGPTGKLRRFLRRLTSYGSSPRPHSTRGQRLKPTVPRVAPCATVVAGAVAAPGLVALATGSSAAWWGFLVLVPVVLAYVGVLFRTRRHLAEREFNVAFFGKSRRGAAGLEEVFSGPQSAQWGPK